MSKRGTKSAGTVSLFPFLAVLVCAMGALILLLLVTTRRIRQRTLAEESAASTSVGEVVPDDASIPVVPAPSANETPDPADVPILPLLAADPPSARPAPHDPTPALLLRLAELEAEQSTLSTSIQRLHQQLATLAPTADAEAEAIAKVNGDLESLAVEKERLSNLYIRLREQQKAAEERANELRDRIREARAQLADTDSKFAIVPYDGHSGTTRRPIVIECTADRLTFASEGIALSASDLDGFIPRYNPLLYVTQALTRYWERRDRTSISEDIGEPYVLLVVRPGGTSAYYVARELLGNIQQPFGYELVTDDQQFAWPSSEPEAVAICRTIIEKMLSERNKLMDVALRAGADLSEFSNDQGQFRLEEIERLQNPTQEVTINGQRFSRGSSDVGGRRDAGHSDASGGYQNGSSGAGGQESSGYGRLSGRGERTLPGAMGEDSAAARSVYTQQNTAVTQANRMPEWLRDGTARLDQRSPRSGTGNSTDGASSTNATATANAPRGRSGIKSAGSGQSDSFDPGAALSGPPVEASPSPEMQTLTPDRNRGEARMDLEHPQWGHRTATGTIGYERDVRIRLTETQIGIGKETAVQMDGNLSNDDLRRILAAAINREVLSWGPPPRSFYWVPSVRFVIETAGGGARHHERLRNIVNAWDIRSTAEYVTEETDS